MLTKCHRCLVANYTISEKNNLLMTSLHSCSQNMFFLIHFMNDENHQVGLVYHYYKYRYLIYTSIPIQHSDNFKKCAFTYPQNQNCLNSTCQIKNKRYYREVIIRLMLWFRENSKWHGSSIALTYTCKFYLRKTNYWRASMICIGLPLKGRTSTVNKQYRLTQ